MKKIGQGSLKPQIDLLGLPRVCRTDLFINDVVLDKDGSLWRLVSWEETWERVNGK